MSAPGTIPLSLARPTGTWGRLLDFPLVRIVIALLFLIPEIAFHNLTTILVVEKLPEPWSTVLMDCIYITDVFLILMLYRWYVRRIEKREPSEVDVRGWFSETGRGLLLALGMVDGPGHRPRLVDRGKLWYRGFLGRRTASAPRRHMGACPCHSKQAIRGPDLETNPPTCAYLSDARPVRRGGSRSPNCSPPCA